MPKCHRCHNPIIFLKRTEDGRSHPIDINPNAKGFIVIYETPGPIPGGGDYARSMNGRRRETVYRKIIGEAAKRILQENGVAFYQSHFDSCPAIQRPTNTLANM